MFKSKLVHCLSCLESTARETITTNSHKGKRSKTAETLTSTCSWWTRRSWTWKFSNVDSEMQNIEDSID